jgi:ribokinase
MLGYAGAKQKATRMTIFNLGSINADYFYRVPHIPPPGETLAATEMSKGLGGKGANMSVAAARAGSRVLHIGAVGADGRWAVERLDGFGVDTSHIAEVAEPTAHAIISIDAAGENSIIIFPGANQAIEERQVRDALSKARPQDTVLLQNETCLQAFSAELGSKTGARVAYAAAPFNAEAVQAVLPYLDFLILNEIEAQQLEEATGMSPDHLPVRDVVVTLGSKGCRWYDDQGRVKDFPAQKVTPVDTTGAGDTFTGYLLAGLDQGQSMEEAIDLAGKAAAIMVTRLGTADVIPSLAEVQAAGFD